MSVSMQHRLGELESLTRDYARYSRSAGGISSILGGVLCLLAYFAGPLLSPIPAVRASLIAVPVAWLLAKWWMTRRYYQRFGHVEEQEARAERLVHRFCLAVTLLVAVAISIGVGVAAQQSGWTISAGGIGYLVLIWLMVLAVWRWLRSPLDFIVGVFLFCQAAVVSAGSFYPLIGTTDSRESMLMSLVALMFPLAALALIANGVAEHRRFQALRAQLERVRGAAGAP